MDEELKALLEEAQASGASRDDLLGIVTSYNSKKKKESLASEEVSPFPSQLETDSSGSPSTGGLVGEEEFQGSDSTTVGTGGEFTTEVFDERPSAMSFKTVTDVGGEFTANLLDKVYEDFDSIYVQTVREQFDVERLINAFYRTDQLSVITGQRIEDRRERVAKGAVDYFLPDEKYDVYVNAYRKAESDEERDFIKNTIVNEIFEDGIDTEAGRIMLLTGVSERVSDYGRYGASVSLANRDIALDKFFDAINPFKQRGGKTIDPSRKEREFLDPLPLEEIMDQEEIALGGKAAQVAARNLKEQLPEDLLNNRTALQNYEKFLLDRYNLGIDLSEDGYLGGGGYHKTFAGGSGASFSKSIAKLLHGSTSFASDVLESTIGDTRLTRYLKETSDSHKRGIEALDDKIPIPLDSFSEKTEGIDSIGELAKTVEDGLRLTSESGPMMLAAIFSGLATRGRFVVGAKLAKTTAKKQLAEAALKKSARFWGAQNLATFGSVSAYGMATTYSDVREKEWFQDMDVFERAAYVGSYGIAEGLPAMVGASVGKKVLSSLTKKGAEGYVKGYLKASGIGMLEEGLTEATTAGVQYLLEVSANPNKAFNEKEFVTAVKDGAYAGIFMAGAMSTTIGGGKLALTGVFNGALALYAPGVVRDQVLIKEIQKEYDQQTTREGRAAIGQKLVEALQSAATNKAKRTRFYEHIRKNSPEVYKALIGIQGQMISLGIQYGKVEGDKAKEGIRAKMQDLYEQRSNIEIQEGGSYSINAAAEVQAILDNVSKVDDFYRGYGGLFQDGDSVEVTAENVDEVSETIENTTGETISTFDRSGVNSGAQIVQSIKNAMAVVRALTKSGKFKGLVIHRTQESFRNVTRTPANPEGELSRGIWTGKGKIHLYAPAVKENTSYHEAYHDIVLESLGEGAIRKLSLKLFGFLSGDLKNKYTGFLLEYLGDEIKSGEIKKTDIQDNPVRVLKNLFKKGRFEIAEEFLMELLGDITNEDVSIEFKRSMVNRFGDFIRENIENISPINISGKFKANPKLEDLVNAIEKMTGQLREGEEVTGIEELNMAAKRMGYAVMATEVDDLENKLQKPEARLRDVEEVTDASRYAEAMAAAINRDKELGRNLMIQVSPLTTEDVQKMLDDGAKLFMTRDGLAGAYVTADGYMGGLFKNADSELGRVSVPLQDVRRAAGGKFFDAYATRLENMYVDNGFKPVARLDFNPDFAPEGWDAETSPLKDQPDVVFFVDGEGKVGEGIRMEEYQNAFDYASNIANKKQQGPLVELHENKPGIDSFLEAENTTAEALEVRKGELKLDESQRQKRVPEAVNALKSYVANEMTQEQYLEAVKVHSPIKPFLEVPEIPSTLDIGAALNANKLESGIIGMNKNIPDNYYTGVRLDIPAYDHYDVWVVSIHQGKRAAERTPFLQGKSIGYAQTALIKDVQFDSTPKAALKIALGLQKTTIARMFGDWNNHSPEALRERAVKIMEGDQYNISDLSEGKLDGWIQVGMNPFRHSWFYDKRDGKPVVAASEVIQIGALVLAKDAEKVSVTDERFTFTTKEGATVKFQSIAPGQNTKESNPATLLKPQKFGLFETLYDIDSEDREIRKKFDDNVEYSDDLRDLVGDDVVLSMVPDNMFVGKVTFESEDGKESEVIFEGGGGLFHPIKTGNTWAFKKVPKGFANKINKMLEDSPSGKVYLSLMTGTDEMLLSSTGGVEGVSKIIGKIATKLAEEKIMSEAQYGRVIIESYKEVFKDSKKLPIPIGKSEGSNIDIGKRIIEYMSDTSNKVTFKQRTSFQNRVTTTFNNTIKVAIPKEKMPKAREIVGKILGIYISNRQQIGTSIKNTAVKILTEKFLNGVPQKHVYAVIEIDSPVIADSQPENPSYPGVMYMLDENGNKKTPKIYLLKNKIPFDSLKVKAEKEDGTVSYLNMQDYIKLATTEGIMSAGKLKVFSVDAALTSFRAKLGIGQAQDGAFKLPPESEAVNQAKLQGPLTRRVADMLDKAYPNPSIKRDNRRKNPVSVQDDTSNQLSSFTYKKKEVIKILVDSGLTKSAAEALYKSAVAYKTGRTAGKKEAMKVAAKVEREKRKLSTEAKNLRNKLEEVMNKSKTFKEFMDEAIKIIDERMKENNKTPFTRGQLARLFKAVAAAHRTSSKKVQDSGLDAMQSAIDRISKIFDERDAKAALEQYLKAIKITKKLQDRLKRMSKGRKKGEALKSRATYTKIARVLASIDPALIPQSELQAFVATIMNTIDSMSTATAKFDKEEEVYVGVAPEKIEANLLSDIVSNFKAMEELGRQAVFVAKAERRAKKNKTSFQEEYDKITKNYERSRLSASRRAILNYIDEYNEKNQNDQLDPANPAHVEQVVEELARQAAEKDELKKESIINDVMIPRIVMNIEKILEDSQLAEILGVFKAEDLDVNALRERLNQLDRIHIINLDYKIDDYVVNDSKFGIGYLHSLVMGKLDFPKRLRDIMKSKNLKARDKVVLRLMDTVDSFLRNLIVTDNKTMAKLRVALGLAGMETAFSKADFIHSQLVELMNNEIKEIEKEGGSVTTRFDRAIMQVFSMSRQIPSVEVEGENAAAIWYNQLRDSMKRTIEYYEKENKTALTKSELEEIRDAYNFLFSNTNNIQELQDKVKNERPELVRFVDFMVDVHNSQAPSFSNYVERYLGKELVLEDNYTPFDIRVKNKNQDVEDILKVQRGMQMALQATTLSKTKKVAGSSFERNPRSLSGGRNIIGLDFISINERTLRENVILSNTVGEVAKASFVLNSDAVAELIPSEPMRKELEKKFMTYVAQDTGKVPDVFKSTFTLFGRKLRNNPLNILRNAVIVKAFGGFIKQTITQSSVLISVMFQTKNPLQSIPYLMQVVAEMAIYTGRTFAQKDSKLALDKGRYDLLKNSPVFQRDYEAGNIDPYSGAMNFDETKLEKIQKKLRDISLKNLKGTDKVAAVASWFAFYGDFLISEGVVDSFNEIDWNAEAANPNQDALSHANSMVSKDQAASTPRQAADLYTDSKDEKAAISWYARNILLPFSRFAVNKKRSIMSDLLKLGKKETAGEGAVATLGHLSELTLFAAVNAVIIPALMSILFGDDEEISEEEKKKRWYRVLGQVIVDFQPLPPLSFIDDNIKGATNKFVLYPMDRMTYGDYSIGDEDGYERWKRTEGGIDVYTPIQKAIDGDVFGVIGSVAGPYGDYIADVSNTIENLSTPGNKIISMSGQEYYVRPEDKQAMDTHFALKTGLTAAQLLGFSNKELDLYIRKIDDTPKERKFRSEEELAAYEEFALQYLQESNPELVKAIMDTEGDVGEARIMNLVEGKAANPFDQQRAANRFKSAIKPIQAEFYMKQNYPEEFTKYNREFRKLSRTLKDGKDYYVFMRSKKEEMKPAEFSKYKEFADTYFKISKPRMISEKIYLEENYIEE